jgi:hypothetical protein
MRCGRCNASVADDDRFFSDCGAPLEVACPSCGEPVAVRELLSQYFAAARTVIGRYGGVVEKFIDDAVMAVWGTPVATEGDAERAVRAALDLVARVAELGQEADVPGLAVRAGVVTGEVAVNLGAVQEGMVAGDAVNTAARVQAAAEAMMATLHDLRTSESPDDLMSLDVLEAEVAVARGAPEDALRRARSALAHADTLGLSSMSWTWALAVRAAFELADHAAVRELLAMLDSYPLGPHPPVVAARARTSLRPARRRRRRSGSHNAFRQRHQRPAQVQYALPSRPRLARSRCLPHRPRRRRHRRSGRRRSPRHHTTSALPAARRPGRRHRASTVPGPGLDGHSRRGPQPLPRRAPAP